MRNRKQSFCVAILAVCLAGLFCRPSPGQESWVYSPYRIKVWTAYDSSPYWTKKQRQRIAARLSDWTYIHADATWKTEIVEPSADFQADILRTSQLDVKTLVASSEKPVLDKDDKIMVVGFRDELDGFHLTASELDCRTRTWGPIVTRKIGNPGLIATSAFDAMSDCFLPIARIETSKGKHATALMRSGGLVVQQDSPANISKGHVLRAIVRRNNRQGEPLDGGIVEIPFTYLFVRGPFTPEGAKKPEEFTLDLRVYSSHSNPITSRRSSRTLRMAVFARPLLKTTDLQLLSKEKPPKQLQGYNIYSRDPQLIEPESLRKVPSRLLGQTDWRGIFNVQRGGLAMRVLYVRNGQQVIARLPVVPGLQARTIGVLPNDDYRLQAEAYVTGIQHGIMDLVIQREVLAARIRYLAKNDKVPEATQMIDGFAKMTSKAQIRQMVDKKRAELTSMLTANKTLDNRTAGKIDRLFSVTRKILDKYVDTELPNKLLRFVKEPTVAKEKAIFGDVPKAAEGEAELP